MQGKVKDGLNYGERKSESYSLGLRDELHHHQVITQSESPGDPRGAGARERERERVSE